MNLICTLYVIQCNITCDSLFTLYKPGCGLYVPSYVILYDLGRNKIYSLKFNLELYN